jgi:succinate dehydrogenase flavin-adding protein (antitoxin of CptAB toxin-antitoxin module)
LRLGRRDWFTGLSRGDGKFGEALFHMSPFLFMNADYSFSVTFPRKRLEVDVLLGTWASLNVSSLTMDELDQFENFVNLETIDIYNIITLRTDVPDFMQTDDGSGVVERIQEWARSSPLGKGSPEKYSKVKKEHNLI